MSATAPALPERDPLDPRLCLEASGLLREFNLAGVLSAADVHVARRLAQLAGERDEQVALAVALAVRAPRLGHVLVDLERIRETAAVDGEAELDPESLRWPTPSHWVAAVRASALVALEEEGPRADRPLRLDGPRLYLDRYWADELAVAQALQEMAVPAAGVDEDRLRDGLRRLYGDQWDGAQAWAAAGAVRRRLAVVAGGPGTGKTTTVARIVALVCEQGGSPLVALAAPTGRAAARLQEAVCAEAERLEVGEPVREVLSSVPATTLHRLLGWRPGSATRFRHGREQRLPHDVVIVDECSMVSLSMMARLIEALRSGARLVLVGDPGQLASIEAGAVLGDIVGPTGVLKPPSPAAGLAEGIVVLDRGHRFGRGIARLAAAIRAGDADETLALLRAGGEEITWIEADPDAAADGSAGSGPLAPVAERALRAARAMGAAARDGRRGEALAALGSFRVLCAHRHGRSGVSGWTARLEAWLGEEIPELAAGERWYTGRPLLVSANDYELGLYNGDSGVVVRAAEDRLEAVFARGGEPVAFAPSRLDAVQTLYAMTIHKSQGSQFDAAAVLLPSAEARILTRELLYTAVTRARERLLVVGSAEAVTGAVRRPAARASGLARRLWG